MLPHISDDLSSSFIEKLEGMLQKYRGETVNFDSRKVRKFKEFKFPRLDRNTGRCIEMTAAEVLRYLQQEIHTTVVATTDKRGIAGNLCHRYDGRR